MISTVNLKSAEPKNLHPDEFVGLLSVIGEIYHAEPPAQFNWPEHKAKDELGQASVLWLEETGGECASFICYRSQAVAFEITVLGTGLRWKRKGLQSQVIQHLQRLAALQKKEIWLEVHSQNQAALRLYTKLGFKVLRERKKYYSDGSSALEMRWSIDNL